MEQPISFSEKKNNVLTFLYISSALFQGLRSLWPIEASFHYRFLLSLLLGSCFECLDVTSTRSA